MISFICTSCGRQFSVPDNYAGRQARCACKQVLVVPAATQPPVAPVAIAARPIGMRARRLVADEVDLRETFDGRGVGRIVSTRGEPPESYVIELRVRSLVSGSQRESTTGDLHQIEVQLTNDYPRVAPMCRMLTPIFHPNIDASSICIGDHWAAGERLSDLTLRIAEMLAYQAYNIRSPLNATAAMWADTHPQELPIDARDLRARAR